jgi:hypothetical protein
MKKTHLFHQILILIISHLVPSTVLSMASPNSEPTKPMPFPVMQNAADGKPVFHPSGELLSVPTKMNYVTPDTVEVNVRRDVSGCDSVYEGVTWDPVDVSVENARDRTLTLDENGFELQQDPIAQVDFLDTHSVITDYYPTCEQLLQRVLGPKAKVIKAFDHNVRISSSSFGEKLKGSTEAKAQVPLGMVHGDYTKISGPKRLADLAKPPKANDVLKEQLGDTPLLDPEMVEAATKGKRRFELINVWRCIDTKNPVQEFPLACVDAKTFDPTQSLKTLFIHYQDRVGENYFCSHDPKQQWCYFPLMTCNEAMLIKQWDSFGALAQDKADGTRSTFGIHSAFIDPTTPDNAAPRTSIEVRCAVIWEEE